MVSEALCSPRDEKDLKIKAKEDGLGSLRQSGTELWFSIMVSPSNLLSCKSGWHFVFWVFLMMISSCFLCLHNRVSQRTSLLKSLKW